MEDEYRKVLERQLTEIRLALEMPDATITEILMEIERLRRSARAWDGWTKLAEPDTR
jgi:hypothetical protein